MKNGVFFDQKLHHFAKILLFKKIKMRKNCIFFDFYLFRNFIVVILLMKSCLNSVVQQIRKVYFMCNVKNDMKRSFLPVEVSNARWECIPAVCVSLGTHRPDLSCELKGRRMIFM